MNRSATLLICALILAVGCDGDGGGGPDPESCSLTLSTPEAGDVFTSGAEVNIRWQETGDAGLVRVELLRGGSVVAMLAESTANDGYVPWVASGNAAGSGDDYAVRVTALGETGCADTSDLFTIHDTEGCRYAFTNEDSILVAGEVYELTWTSHNGTGTVDIDLQRWTGVIGDVAVNIPDTGSLIWTADSFHHGTDDHFWFEIRDHALPDCSAESRHLEIIDDDICLITMGWPGGGEVLHLGDSRTILFEQTNGGGRVDVLLKAGQTFISYIATGHDAASGSLSWTVDDYGFVGPTEYFRIEIIDSDDSYCRGESDLFTILP